MKESPFFSIVIPVYNCEEYLDECLSSILGQTCKDFELLLIDDEANAATVAILDRWEKEYPELIRVVHQKNSGVYISKQNGLKMAKGEYCYVMDDDDTIISNDTLEKIRSVIEETKSDLIIFNATEDREKGELLYHIPFADGQVFEKESLSELYDHFLDSQNLNHIWLMVFKRTLFDVSYEYDQPFRMSRDGGFLVSQILSNANKAVYLNRALYFWRTQNPSSLSKHYDVIDFYRSVGVLHQRILECSKKWKYKSPRTDDLVHINFMTDICTAAMRVSRLIETESVTKKDCLMMISNDEAFRREYSLRGLRPYRKAVVWALYHRQFWMINLIFMMAKTVKKLKKI